MPKKAGETLPQLAVAWILGNPAITSVILGASRTGQLNDTLAAADYALAPDLKSQLDELTAEYRRGDAGRQGQRYRATASGNANG